MTLNIGIVQLKSLFEKERPYVVFFNGWKRGGGHAGVRAHDQARRRCRRSGLIKLSEMMENQQGTIKAIQCHGPIRRRLLDMGVVPGVKVLLERRAPLGDPIEIKCKTFHISLRVEEAESILVEVEGESEGESTS